VIPYFAKTPDFPDEGPPDPAWLEIMGGVTIEKVEQSLSDPRRIRAEARVEKDCKDLIPIMARIIRGGAYDPRSPSLTFEEEHRLITIFPESFGFCRIDDIYDLWIMMRTTVELYCEAWERRTGLEPESSPRQGIGAVEIFKRLPGTNCGECGDPGCMEFASGLLMSRCRLQQCKPLFEPEFSRHLSSLTWLLKGIGVTFETPASGKETPAP
jgi:ArsR family metal-binding transcriptional regulator